MEEKDFIQRMKEILKEVDKPYEVMPQLFKKAFDRLIERINVEKITYNYVEPKIILQQDVEGNYFISYINENGDLLQILDDNTAYVGLEKGIKVNVSTAFSELERVIKEKQLELANSSIIKQNEILQKIKIGELDFQELSKYNSWLAEQLASLKHPIADIERMLNNYERELQSRNVYNIRCNVAEREGSPRGPRVNPTPPTETKEEFNLQHRLEGIEKIMPSHEMIIINDGEYYAYVYDLAQNKNGESGYIIMVEPEKNERIATRVIHLSQEEFSKLKSENKDKEDIQIKAMYLKEILEDTEKLEQTSKIKHTEYGKWLAIMDYYIKGNREINPEILEIINEEKNPEGFKKTFPRQYLRELREDLLSDKGER